MISDMIDFDGFVDVAVDLVPHSKYQADSPDFDAIRLDSGKKGMLKTVCPPIPPPRTLRGFGTATL